MTGYFSDHRSGHKLTNYQDGGPSALGQLQTLFTDE
jgi:hypothetical protein